MKSPLINVLLAALAVSAVVSICLCWGFISNARELRKLQIDAAMVNNNRAMVNSLANEAVEYAKTHPAMDAIIEAAGLKPGKPAATKPAAK